MCGKPGTGKNHLALAIARHAIIEHQSSVIFTTALKIAREYKSTWSIRHSLNEWWALWQASRAAIEIELPESFTMHSGRTPYLYVSEVQSAIRAAGVKVKE